MLRKYVRQLNPIQENTTPLDKVQLFTEARDTPSTYFEGVIAACHNGNKNENIFKKEILKNPTVVRFLAAADKMSGPKNKVFATKGKSEKEKLDILWKFSQVCKKNLSGTTDAGAGQSKLKISEPWTEQTDKKIDTSKADIMVGGKQTSVKGPSAQLMSGVKSESKATILAALEISGGGDKLREELLTLIDKFVDNTRTIGADISAGILKKMSVEAAKKSGNEAAKKIVDEQEKNKKDITNAFNKAFQNQSLRDAFALESMTGYEKFGGKAYPDRASGDQKGEATHMLIWDYSMDRIKFLPITGSFVSQTAKKMNIKPDLKSGSYKLKGQKAGYSFYQALRVGVDVVLNKQGEIENTTKEELEYNENLLSEGKINEVDFKSKFKKILDFAKNKILGLYRWLANHLKKIVDSVIGIVKKGIYFALQVFELDVDVDVKPVVDLKI